MRERKKGKNECKAKAFFASITLLQVSKEFVGIALFFFWSNKQAGKSKKPFHAKMTNHFSFDKKR